MNKILYVFAILLNLGGTVRAQVDDISFHKNILKLGGAVGEGLHNNVLGIKQAKKSITEAVNTDLSYLISGQYGDLIKNSFSISFVQPSATASFVIKLSRKTVFRNYGELINFTNSQYAGGTNLRPTTLGLSNRTRAASWRKSSTLALQLKFTGGITNNIATVFANTKVNPKTALQIGLVWILPGSYQYERDSFELMAMKLSKIQRELSNQRLTLIDSKKRWVAIRDKLNTEASSGQRDINIEGANQVIDSLDKKIKAIVENFGSTVRTGRDKAFDNYGATRKIYQWFVQSHNITYNENIRYTPLSDFTIAKIDTVRYPTYTAAISYNLLLVKNRNFQNIFWGAKAAFSYADNLQTASAMKLKTDDVTVTTVNGIAVKQPGISADAYNAKDIKRSFVFNLNTNLIYYFDKTRIVGFNPGLDIVATPEKPVALNVTAGLTFSVPQSAGDISVNAATKSVLNISPFVTIRDVTQGQIDVLAPFVFKNHVTLGFTADVPFAIFGK